MTLYQFLLILRARYKVILLVFLAAISAAVIAGLILPKKYTAQTSLLVDVRTPDPVAGAGMSGVIAPSYMATQVEIIGGDLVATRVMKIRKQRLPGSSQLKARVLCKLGL